MQEDSDTGSGVMVRAHSQQSEPTSTDSKSAWVVVDADTKSPSSSKLNVDADLSTPTRAGPSAAQATSAAVDEADEEAQLAAALAASAAEDRETKIARMREDRQVQKAIEASKMEAVAYALGTIDAESSAASRSGVGMDGQASDSEDTDSTTGWTSSDDDDDEDQEDRRATVNAEDQVAPQTEAEIRQHTIERLRVLEAAGVLVKADDLAADAADGADQSQQVGASQADDSVKRTPTKAGRRPPPPPGQKRHKNLDELMMLSRSRTAKRPSKPEEPERRKPPSRPKKRPSRDLPALPTDAASSAAPTQTVDNTAEATEEDRMEDAYDRYLKLTKEVSLQPILPATAAGAAAKNSMVPPASPPPFATGSPARPSSAAGESSSRTSGFLSTIKSMSHRSNWTGSSGAASRPESGIGSRIVSGPIAMGASTPTGGLLQAASISEPQRASGESSEASESAAARSGAPSWSSLVGRELLSGLSDTERKRQEAIFELIATETAHVRDVQIIVEVFFNSMQTMLSAKASTVIFANIESVLVTAVSYLSDLEARQKEDRLFVSAIGDVLERHMPAMSVYLPYCVNQQSASEILAAERKRDTRVDIHLLNLRSNHPAARGLDLSHFLLVPMQRLTRYPLLLAQILRYTPEDHVDHARVASAKQTAEDILAKTNEAIEKTKTRRRCPSSRRICGWAKRRVWISPSRLSIRLSRASSATDGCCATRWWPRRNRAASCGWCSRPTCCWCCMPRTPACTACPSPSTR